VGGGVHGGVHVSHREPVRGDGGVVVGWVRVWGCTVVLSGLESSWICGVMVIQGFRVWGFIARGCRARGGGALGFIGCGSGGCYCGLLTLRRRIPPSLSLSLTHPLTPSLCRSLSLSHSHSLFPSLRSEGETRREGEGKEGEREGGRSVCRGKRDSSTRFRVHGLGL